MFCNYITFHDTWWKLKASSVVAPSEQIPRSRSSDKHHMICRNGLHHLDYVAYKMISVVFLKPREVSIVHGFSRFRSRSRRMSVAQLVCLRLERNLCSEKKKYNAVENPCERITCPISGQVFPNSET